MRMYREFPGTVPKTGDFRLFAHTNWLVHLYGTSAVVQQAYPELRETGLALVLPPLYDA